MISKGGRWQQSGCPIQVAPTNYSFTDMTTAGSVSYDEFRSLVDNFVDRSNKIDDKWHIQYGAHGGVYMCKKVQVVPGAKKAAVTSPPDLSEPALPHLHDIDEHEATDLLSDMETESEVDNSCMPTENICLSTPFTYEYHVVYSESYSVPVLFFNIFKPDGKRLSLEEVWKLCPSAYQSYMAENKWNTLTQQEHPLLGRPYLQLHPCHTSSLMAQITSGLEDDRRQNYLVAWLSTVGPVAGLHISPEYIT